MSDDIVTRLREGKGNDIVLFKMMDEAADEIERLRKYSRELAKLFQQVGVVAEMWQKSEDELIELHHDKCAEQFAEQHQEIERLRAECDKWKKVAKERNPYSWANLVRKKYGMEDMYER